MKAEFKNGHFSACYGGHIIYEKKHATRYDESGFD